jgi:hypothetical protein
VPSICIEEHLNRLIWEGVLPDMVTGRWHPAAVEDFPTPEAS